MSRLALPVAILAGGLATRLHPVTQKVPKALLEVNGEPFLAHQLRLLRARGIRRVVICVGYLGEMIGDFVGNGQQFDLQVEVSFDGPLLLGTGGTIRRALPLLGEAFLVLYGDSYLPCDYGLIAEKFLSSGKLAMMTVFRNEGRWDTSNVEFADNLILAYDKKNRTPRMRHIDYGLGAFKPDAFSTVSDREPTDLATLYQVLLREGELAAFEVQERFYEIGSFEGLKETEEFLKHSPFDLEAADI